MLTSPPVPSRRTEHIDLLHGETVPDPYRWLEDSASAETARWVRAQSERTRQFLSSISGHAELQEALAQIWDYPRADPPFQKGSRWFQWRNSGLQDQPVLYLLSSPADPGAVLLDPGLMSPDGTVSVTAVVVSEDGNLLAYGYSVAGSDWRTWRVRDVISGDDLDDVVEWTKWSYAQWAKDGSGFFYTAFEPPPAGAELVAETGPRWVSFHTLGTPQADDKVVWPMAEDREWEPWATVSDDGRYLVVTIAKGTSPNTRTEIFDLGAPGKPPVVLVPDFSCQCQVVANVGHRFYAVTDLGAQRRRIMAVELPHPGLDDWEEVVPEGEAVLVGASNVGGRLVCHYLEDASSRLRVYGFDGVFSHDVEAPAACSVTGQVQRDAGLEGNPWSTLLHFGTESYTDPGSIWRHDLETQQTELVRAAKLSHHLSPMETDLVLVPASDGAKVPLFITRRCDLVPDGEARVWLYGYGGFDIPLTPAFNRAAALWAERGGVYAVACLRGGGEYGRSWHDAGRLANKQRVFDDFCDCARWLASAGWSRAARIGINGGSNGGLLVGACLVQHPELFGAAVPEVGVLDMLRFHKFTIGWAWKSDFGDPDDPEDFKVLRGYSPLHNVRQGITYPPTLIMTGDHDDRVVPAHSYKFAAALQAAQANEGPPILLRVETSTGHAMGKPTSKVIGERADMLSFLEWALSGSGGGRAP